MANAIMTRKHWEDYQRLLCAERNRASEVSPPLVCSVSFDDWCKMPPKDAAEYFQKRVGIDDERKAKLVKILEYDRKGVFSQNSQLSDQDGSD